jgi:hypothetical protein
VPEVSYPWGPLQGTGGPGLESDLHGVVRGLGAIRALLEQAVSEGTLPPQPLDVVAHLLLAAVDEAALFTNSPEPGTAKEQALEAVERLITGLTSPAPKSLARKSKRTT